MLPPLGVLSIASYLEQNGFEVQVVDIHAEECSPEQFRNIVRRLKPRFVGITVLSTHFLPSNLIAKIVKETISDAKVIVGGVHAEAEPEQMLRNPSIDAVCRGDGEEVMLEYVRGIDNSQIRGLSYRNNQIVCHNPPQEQTSDLDQYPFPAYHLVDFDNYFPPVASYKDLPAMNVLMTRGCPGKCTFCNSAKTVLRGRSVIKMIELISMLRYTYGIRQIYFYDDTFTANPKLVKEFCNEMIKRAIDVRWICYVRGDMFKEPIAELMSRAGCHQVFIGIESGSETIMKDIGKPIKRERYKRVVDIAHKNDIEVRASFIIGHPDETEQTMEETLSFAKYLEVDFFQVNIMTPYPGTILYKQLKEQNLIIHERYERYGQNELVFNMKYLKPEQVTKFETRSFYRFFLRPKIMRHQLARLSNWNHVKDLIVATYIVLVGGYSSQKTNIVLEQWLDYDAEAEAIPSISLPEVPRLTYEVRQDPMFSVGVLPAQP
jgi:radical SAM superfamily enzyme YgiQ (UPF0313 family)